MSLSPNSALVQRTIDLHYANKKRSSSYKWIVVNTICLIVFVYDLWCKCPGYTTGMHYAEVAAAGALAASLALHARRVVGGPAPAAALPLSRAQRRLLGLAATDLDSSFVLTEEEVKSGHYEPASEVLDSDVSLSLAARVWRAAAAAPAPRSPHSPHSPHSPQRAGTPPGHSGTHSPPVAPLRSEPAPRDRFFSDRRSLADYLKQYEEQLTDASEGTGLNTGAPAWAPPALTPPPPAYQLSALDSESSKLDESSPQGSPQVWWRLHLDPQRLTEWNLNLRLWIHVTILERLVRELRAAGPLLARLSLAGGAGGAGAAAGGAGGAGGAPRLAALLPYLEPFADQRYVVQRIIELAQGGCLSNYKWNGGGSDWDESKPTDAEIILHLLATYLDGQMPQAGNPRPFSSQYLSAAPAPPPRGPRALALHRVSARPPHFALALAGDTLELARGRDNLLHALLLLLAAAARRHPPALARTHLGPAGLNMLWIIGR